MEKEYNKKRPNIPADIKRQIEVDAGHKCTIKNCNEHTYLEIHHINLNREDNSIDNLILLCGKHHKMAHADKIDRKALKEYKQLLNIHIQHQKTMINNNTNSFYTNLAKEFENRILEVSIKWLETLPDVDWSLKVVEREKLYSLIKWIESRDWIEDNNIKSSFKNLSNNMLKAMQTFEKYMKQPQNGYYFIDKFYKKVDYSLNPELRTKLEKKFDKHIDSLINITIEIANNINTIFRLIREYIDDKFLLDVGIIPNLHGKQLV